MNNIANPDHDPQWQDPKYLQHGETVWILTDIERFWSRYLDWSEPQELFRVGVYDLNTQRIGFAVFGRDIAYALLKARFPLPPWTTGPLPHAFTLKRRAHAGEEKGRYCVQAEAVEVPSDVRAMAATLAKRFARTDLTPNLLPGVWKDLEERAARETAIEAAVESMRPQGSFAAGDIKEVVGKDVNITTTLRRLVEDRVICPIGKKRGRRYHFRVPQIIERADWSG